MKTSKNTTIYVGLSSRLGIRVTEGRGDGQRAYLQL